MWWTSIRASICTDESVFILTSLLRVCRSRGVCPNAPLGSRVTPPSTKGHGWIPVTPLHTVNWRKDGATRLHVPFSQSSPVSNAPPSSFIPSLHRSLLLSQCPNVTVAVATQVLRPGSFPASPAVPEGNLGICSSSERLFNPLHVTAGLSGQIRQNNKQSPRQRVRPGHP